MIELEAGDARLTVHPLDGGRLGRLRVGSRDLLQHHPSRGAMGWGSFPMAPWAGRVREGRFTFDDRPYRLPINLAPHAIHGTTFTAEWEVLDAGRDHCELQCRLDWPFGGTAHQHIHLHEQGVTCVLTVYATALAMPAVVGWHPCFVKPPDADLEFTHMYRRDLDHMAVPVLIEPAPHPWDDCFTGPRGPLRLRYPGLTLTVASDCDHWVVFDGLDDALCVEPQSGPPDAFTIGGATRLQPGDLLQRRMTFHWAPEP
ncbi:MAG: aldose epimerase [Actinomycetota bacterium]|nr:aldose epimerase [Actinomycetota bacterium]